MNDPVGTATHSIYTPTSIYIYIYIRIPTPHNQPTTAQHTHAANSYWQDFLPEDSALYIWDSDQVHHTHVHACMHVCWRVLVDRSGSDCHLTHRPTRPSPPLSLFNQPPHPQPNPAPGGVRPAGAERQAGGRLLLRAGGGGRRHPGSVRGSIDAFHSPVCCGGLVWEEGGLGSGSTAVHHHHHPDDITPTPQTPTHQTEKRRMYRIAGGDVERYGMHSSYVSLDFSTSDGESVRACLGERVLGGVGGSAGGGARLTGRSYPYTPIPIPNRSRSSSSLSCRF